MDASTTTFPAATTSTRRATGARREAPFLPPPGDFLVDDWLVQPMLGRVSRGDTSVRLRPQLMDVLVCLASGNGRTVGKQELLDRVWHAQFVAGTAIARSVTELRQVLGDDARQPRIIQTIPKRGYRVMIPVVPVQRSTPAPAVQTAAAPDTFPSRRPQSVPAFWPLAVLFAVVITVALLLAGRLPA